MSGRVAAVMTAIALCSATPGAVQMPIDYAAIDDALALARGSATTRARYHDAYRLTAARMPIDYVDIVTPFRRVVIAAQLQADSGNRSFGQRQALELLRAAGAKLDVRVEMTFHPQNNLLGVPAYAVFLAGRGTALPISVDRLSRWTPRVDGLPPALPAGGGSGPSRGMPLLGGTLVAQFDLESIDPGGSYDIVIGDAASELARVRLDLKRLR
jgi:hypothetical protein